MLLSYREAKDRGFVRFAEFFADTNLTEGEPIVRFHFYDGSSLYREVVDRTELEQALAEWLHRGDVAKQVAEQTENVHLILRGNAYPDVAKPVSLLPGVFLICDLYVW